MLKGIGCITFDLKNIDGESSEENIVHYNNNLF
jgi:hypothetical protein